MNNYVLECCADSVQSAVNAEKGGANRIELCSALVIGGLSPSVCLFDEVMKNCSIKVNVLLRPRFGDFCYDDYEIEIIKNEIKMFRERGANGVVIGVLKPDGTLDMEKMKYLMEEAKGIDVTLHRAFDVAKDPYKTLEQAKELGVNTILTSGQKNSAMDGAELLKDLVSKSENVDILVGSGVSAEVIKPLYDITKATSYHMSGKVTLESRMTYRKEGVSMGAAGVSEFEIFETSVEKVKAASDLLKAL